MKRRSPEMMPEPPVEEIESTETAEFDPISPDSFEVTVSPTDSKSLVSRLDSSLHPSDHEATSDEAKKVAETIEAMPAFSAYKDQRVTFEKIESILTDFDSLYAGFEDEKDIQEKRQSLANLIESVRDSAERYYNVIVQYQATRDNTMKRMRMDDREFQEELVSIDHRRRRVHDSLLANLRALYRSSKKLIDPERPAVDVMGIDPRKKLFSLDQLTDENRAIAGQWAFNAVVGSRLQKIYSEAQEIIKKNEEA